MRKNQINCIIFRKIDGIYSFLLLKRIPEKGGFWQPPSGGLVKYDKTILDGAYREILEETGITRNDVLNVYENVYSFDVDKHYLTGEPMDAIHEMVLAFEVKNDVCVSLENNLYPEHEDFEWLTFENVLERLKWENNKEAFRKLKGML